LEPRRGQVDADAARGDVPCAGVVARHGGRLAASDGAEIRTALTARVLAWPGGQRQNFLADGRTLYEGDRAQRGRWRIEGDRFCPVWPPSDRWDCYLVERHVRGLDLRFLSGGEAVTEGRYDDLQ